jgi:hypothetical protein
LSILIAAFVQKRGQNVRGVDRAFGRMPGTWVERTVFLEREGRAIIQFGWAIFGKTKDVKYDT